LYRLVGRCDAPPPSSFAFAREWLWMIFSANF
jgi:hypothetical protein